MDHSSLLYQFSGDLTNICLEEHNQVWNFQTWLTRKQWIWFCKDMRSTHTRHHCGKRCYKKDLNSNWNRWWPLAFKKASRHAQADAIHSYEKSTFFLKSLRVKWLKNWNTSEPPSTYYILCSLILVNITRPSLGWDIGKSNIEQKIM